MSTAIAMGVRVPQPAAGATINPFQTMNTLSEIQARQQSMQLQAREMMGQQRFGAILNQAPDLQTGINAAMSDPLAAPYAADSIMRLQNALNTQREITTSIGTEATNGHQAILGALASSDDPQVARNLAMQRFSLMSPEAQKREWPAFSAALTGITGGTEGMPADQASAQFMKNRAAIGVTLGWDADKIKDLNGIPRSFSADITPSSGGPPVTFHTTTPLYPGGPALGPVALNPYSGQLESPQNWTQPAPVSATGAPSPAPPSTVPTGMPPTSTTAPPGGAPGGAPGSTTPAGIIPAAAPTPAEDGVVPPAMGAPAAAAGAPAPAGPPGTVRGPIGQQTGEQKAFQDAEGKRKSEVFNTTQGEVNAAASEIPKLTDGMDQLQNVLQGFLAGPGTETRAQMAQTILGWGSVLGFDTQKQSQLAQLADRLVKGGPNALADEQEFTALVRSYAVNQLKQAATGTGRVMLPEVEAFMKAIDVNMTPQAMMQLINGQGRLAVQRAYDRTQKWGQFADGVRTGAIKQDIGDFTNWYTDHSGPAWRLPTKTTGGLEIGPRDPGTAYGTRSGPTLTYNPQTGGFNPPPPQAQAPVPMPPPQNQLTPQSP